MNLWQSFLEALDSLLSNKMRSGLTMLGIVIGVAAVIAILALGAGASESIIGEIEGIGSNMLYISQTCSDDVRNPKPLTLADANAIRDPLMAPSVMAVAPVLQGSVEITYFSESTNTSVIGVSPEYAVVRKTKVGEGEFISDDHMLGQSAVVVLSTGVADTLFGRTEGLVGETINVEGQPFRVIGVLEEVSGGGLSFGSDDQIIVPLTTAQTRLLRRPTRDQVDTIYVQGIDAESVSQATEEVSVILRTRHRTEIGVEDFSISDQQAILDMAATVTGILTIVLGGIAAISLVVGGIGIMNIMLVSGIERTKEIGLRKAMGARKVDILAQFLVESSLLSLIGGLIGIILGWITSYAVGQVAASSGFALTPVVDLNGILLSTLFSASVGLFFGLYPANRAANLEPVEALRSE